MVEVAAEPVLHEGELLAGRYRLVRPLGEGGMGTVWEGRQITTEKPVALKILKRRDPSDVARFLREARLAAALMHRNIVQVFDCWEVEGGGPVFLVMELLGGETLSARLEAVGRLPLDEVLALVTPVAAALAYAHAQGVVHRDLKPENVFLARTAGADAVEVKVVDFGLARPTLPDAAATAITQSGAIMGTPYYMAPEQVYGDKDVDGRADVWALGAVVWECLAGEKAFNGENFGQIFRRISQAEVRPLRDVVPDAPPWLTTLVMCMLSHDRQARPTMAEVHGALVRAGEPPKDVATRASVPAVQITVRLPGPEVVAQPLAVATRLTATASMRPSVPAPRRLSGLWVGAFVVVACALGGAMFVSAQRDKTPAVLPVVAAPAATPSASVSLAPLPSYVPPSEEPSAAPSAPSPARTPFPMAPRAPRSIGHARTGPPPAATAAAASADPLGRGRF